MISPGAGTASHGTITLHSAGVAGSVAPRYLALVNHVVPQGEGDVTWSLRAAGVSRLLATSVWALLGGLLEGGSCSVKDNFFAWVSQLAGSFWTRISLRFV